MVNQRKGQQGKAVVTTSILKDSIPKAVRLMPWYAKYVNRIQYFDKKSTRAKKKWILNRMKSIVSYAERNIPFYRNLYRRHDFSVKEIISFDDIKKIPIVTKEDMLKSSLSERSRTRPYERHRLSNTGGTSGQPLSFYSTRQDVAREWAHMNKIWRKINYRSTDLKLRFRGVNIGSNILLYNRRENEIIVNTYLDLEVTGEEIKKVAKSNRITFLHGYPSTIYNFAMYCTEKDYELRQLLRNSLKGILLSSEYPANQYRCVIVNAFGIETLSWYGHTEKSVLAYERKKAFVYEPMHSYGFVEAVPSEGKGWRLIGTSYDNKICPFVRYDTGDLVEPEKYEDELLISFKISGGRIGEFILDNSNNRISLTALIFGRHHELFNFARYVQIKQNCPGRATIIITPKNNPDTNGIEWHTIFDGQNVNIEFDYKMVRHPYRASSGKIPLLVP